MYGLIGGTFLNLRTELIQVDRPADLFLHHKAGRLSARVQSDGDLALRLVTGAEPRAVRLDGEVLAKDAYTYAPRGKRLALELPAGIHEIDVGLK